MNCEKCKQNPATVHVTHINNGEKVELHLCEECAKESNQLNFETPISFQNFFQGLLDMSQGGTSKIQQYNGHKRQMLQCPVCHMTYEEFRKTGKIQCAACYDTFGEQLDTVLKSLHGSNRHTGKLPKKAKEGLLLKRAIDELRRQLNESIEQEEYEKAAELRDKIRILEKGEV